MSKKSIILWVFIFELVYFHSTQLQGENMDQIIRPSLLLFNLVVSHMMSASLYLIKYYKVIKS